jgi:radical SAM protein with 4Fe4S-binding SPASM domain
MRWYSSPELERFERAMLPHNFGKRYEPLGPVTLRPDCVLGTRGVDLIELDGETLAIAPESASWVFLTARERQLFEQMDGLRVGELAARLAASGAQLSAAELAGTLFRRGVVTVDGQRSVSDDVLEDSHNTREQHLVELLLTEKCNLACGYCLAGANPRMPTMTEEIGKRSVDLAYRMGEAELLTFEFSGGEPFLQFGLMRRLVDYIQTHPDRRGRTVSLTVQTNATQLDEERVKFLADHGMSVGVSLDGDPESHNWSRPQVNGKESFSKVIRGIDLLQRHNVGFGALIVLNRSNVGSAQRLIDFLVDNGIHSLKLNPVAFLGTGRQNWDEFGLEQREIIDYFKTFSRLLVEQGHLIREANLFTMLNFIVSKQRQTRCMRGHCGAGTSFQAINAKGDIFPCGRATQSPGLTLGNVATETGSLSDPGRRHEQIVAIGKRRPRDLEDCDHCAYRQLCQSGCSAQAFEKYGTVRHKTPECSFFKTLYPYLMRWLSFDAPAFAHFEASGYFDGPAVLHKYDTHAPRPAAMSELRG